MTRRLALLAALLLLSPAAASAHVGSPDVYFESAAGPYRLLVTVRPPEAVPGVAEVVVRAPKVTAMTMVPLPSSGPGARLSPRPDVAARDRDDPTTFVGHLWLMNAGSWQVRLHCDGPDGAAELAVPVPALPQRTRTMQRGLMLGLLALLLLLAAGAVSVVGAAAREGELPPGATPAGPERRRSRVAMAVTALLVVLALVGGNAWWNAEAGEYGRYVYKPLQLQAHVAGDQLALQLTDPGWLRLRQLDDWVPDHGHLMHLYVVAMPAMDRVWHLHPRAAGPNGAFALPLPALPAGRYRLFADVVHANGLAETATTELDLAQATTAAAGGDADDAWGGVPAPFDPARSSSPLDGGARMLFARAEAPTRARQPGYFRFHVADAGGVAQPLEPYMGMLGHAAFVSRDASVFAHVHPSGSVAMASLTALAGGDAKADPHAGHMMHPSADGTAPTEVAFPYGFPRAGDYRIFVQVKRAGHVDTGAFDVHVE